MRAAAAMSPITTLQCDDSVFSFVTSQSRSHIRQPKAPPAMTGRASATVSGFIIVNAAAIPTVTCAFANICLFQITHWSPTGKKRKETCRAPPKGYIGKHFFPENSVSYYVSEKCDDLRILKFQGIPAVFGVH